MQAIRQAFFYQVLLNLLLIGYLAVYTHVRRVWLRVWYPAGKPAQLLYVGRTSFANGLFPKLNYVSPLSYGEGDTGHQRADRRRIDGAGATGEGGYFTVVIIGFLIYSVILLLPQ